MASGDITAIKVLYRQSLGGGQDENGVKKNTKTLIVGQITASWVDTGIAVNKVGPGAFGVNNLDFVKFQVVTINALYQDAKKLKIANYDVTNQKIFLTMDEGQATPVNPTAGWVCVINFLACGDDADAPELT